MSLLAVEGTVADMAGAFGGCQVPSACLSGIFTEFKNSRAELERSLTAPEETIAGLDRFLAKLRGVLAFAGLLGACAVAFAEPEVVLAVVEGRRAGFEGAFAGLEGAFAVVERLLGAFAVAFAPVGALAVVEGLRAGFGVAFAGLEAAFAVVERLRAGVGVAFAGFEAALAVVEGLLAGLEGLGGI